MMKRAATLIALLLLPMLTAETLTDASGRPVRFAGRFGDAPVTLRDTAAKKDEFRGIWVAAVENIDFPAHQDAAAFQRDFAALADKVSRAGFNAVIFQVRSNCDAFYPTSLAPWSRWLTGKEGVGLEGFDPLAFMIRETHRRGMEFHAWFNPYRVVGKTKLSKKAYLATLSPTNFARKHPEWVLTKNLPDGNRQLFLDPGVPQVREHLAAVAEDAARRYPIDAVHFDDYFYPYEKMGTEDAASYARYNPLRLSLEEWRRYNTDELIVAVRRAVDRCNRMKRRVRVRFGISPFGIWANRSGNPAGSLTGGKESYSVLYADTRKWVRNRYVDYIAPQIYWAFDHETAAYAALVSWWCSVVRGTGVKLYIGVGAYNGGKWRAGELVDQVRYNRMQPEVSGAAFFSFRSFFGSTRSRGTAALLRFFREAR